MKGSSVKIPLMEKAIFDNVKILRDASLQMLSQSGKSTDVSSGTMEEQFDDVCVPQSGDC